MNEHGPMSGYGPSDGDRAARSGPLERWFARWMRVVTSAPRACLVVLSALAVASILLAVQTLRVDTDSTRMLAPDLAFQVRARAVSEAFPTLKNAVHVVVRSEIEDAADEVADLLAERLRARDDAVRSVFAPASDPFLVAHGLLYLETPELESRLKSLSESANLLATLRADQTFEGFFQTIAEADTLARRANFDLGALMSAYDEAAGVIEARLEGAEPRPFSWLSAFGGRMGGGDGPSVPYRLVSVEPILDTTELQPARATLAAIRAEIDRLDPELARLVEIGVTGEPALRFDELRSVTNTILISLAISVLLVGVLLYAGLRSASRTALALASLAFSLALTTGFAAAVVGPLNLISIAFIVLMVGLGIDFAIHILAHIDEVARRSYASGVELNARSATFETARAAGAALILSALTTCLAFLAFTVTDFRGMAQLGLIGGVGVLVAFGVSATLIPAVVTIWPRFATGGPDALRRQSLRDRARAVHIAMRRASPGENRRRRAWGNAAAITVLTLAAICAGISTQARFDADPMSLRNPDSESVRAFDWLAEAPRAAPYRASLLVADGAQADAVEAALEALPEVRSAIRAVDLIPDDQDAKIDLYILTDESLRLAVEGEPVSFIDGGRDVRDFAADLVQETAPEAQRLGRALESFLAQSERPDGVSGAEVASDLFRFFPALIDRLALQRLADYVSLEQLPEPLLRRFVSADGVTHRIDITPTEDLRDPAAMRRFVDAVWSVAPEAAGGPAQITPAADTVGFAMLMATLLAFGATGLIAFVATRRALDAAAILAPLIAAGLITIAASVVLNTPFNFANVIVLPLMIGIGVDSGVHIAMRTRRVGADDTVFSTSTPRAVLFSALTTAAAFGTLALSDHRGTASMGLLLVVAMIASIVTVFALTPWIIDRFGRDRGADAPAGQKSTSGRVTAQLSVQAADGIARSAH